MKFMRLVSVLMAFGALGTALGQTYDAFQGFTGKQNPDGVWSYGWSTDLSGPMTVYPNSFIKEGGTNWTDNTVMASGDPNVACVPVGDINGDVPAGTMAFHPGPEGQFSHCRFTAPAAGVYNIQANFTALNVGGPHAYILHNGVSLNDQVLTEGNLWSADSQSVTLAAGDTVEAVVGVGPDNSYVDDETMFSFVVTLAQSTPPPAQMVWQAGAGYSGTQNPNGVWTYAWSTNLAGPLTTYPDSFVVDSSTAWGDSSIQANYDPNVSFNPPGGQVRDIPDNSMGFSAGPGNQFSHCLFTAPVAGTYLIQGTFSAASYGVPHVYILKNGVDIADSTLAVGATWSPSTGTVTLAQGDTIDAVAGVGPDNIYFNDEIEFNLTISNTTAPQSGTLAKGVYAGLVTGTSGPGGVVGLLTAHVQYTGAFTAVLNFEGKRIPFNGAFNISSTWSGTVKVGGGKELAVSLGFDTNGNLTGTITEGSSSYLVSAGSVSKKLPALGVYPFTIATSPAPNVPGGTGYGFLYVRSSGAATLSGQLADGTGFTAASVVTSGSAVPVFANPYGLQGGGLAGTLYFQSVPSVSDATGTLSWTRPVTQAVVPYADGFSTSTSFVADLLDPAITGLKKDHVSLVASGADLTSNLSATITLAGSGTVLPIESGRAANVQLFLVPVANVFYGSFVDSTTHAPRDFSGVLLPDSRTGAGYFISNGQSGSVNISY